MQEDYRSILEQAPFMSYLTYGGNEYIGIIQNVDELITSVYDYGLLRTEDEKIRFLKLGETWWWESNRTCPINLFLRNEWIEFRPTLRVFNNKDVILHHGPYVSLNEMSQKRTKRKSITLIKRIS